MMIVYVSTMSLYQRILSKVKFAVYEDKPFLKIYLNKIEEIDLSLPNTLLTEESSPVKRFIS